MTISVEYIKQNKPCVHQKAYFDELLLSPVYQSIYTVLKHAARIVPIPPFVSLR